MPELTAAQKNILKAIPANGTFLPNTSSVRSLVSKGLVTRDEQGHVQLVQGAENSSAAATAPAPALIRDKRVHLSWVPADEVVKNDDNARLDDAIFFRSGSDEFSVRFDCGEYSISFSLSGMRAMLDVLESHSVVDGGAFPEDLHNFA